MRASLLGAVVVLACSAPAADGATVTVDGGLAVYTARSGEVNRLQVDRVPGTPFAAAFTDYIAPVTVGPGCVPGTPIVCSTGPVVVHLGDLSDVASVVPFFEDATVFAGPGDDDVLADGQIGIADGGSGNDVIRVSGNGSARADGGPGDDQIAGAAEAGALFDGGGGSDLIVATGSVLNDVNGQAGNDVLVARAANRRARGTLAGGAGDDLITFPEAFVGAEGWTFDGGRGDDTLNGPAAQVDSGPGDDRIAVVGGTVSSTVACSSGFDVVWADPTDVVNADCERRIDVTEPPAFSGVAEAVAAAHAVLTHLPQPNPVVAQP
jgi:Ca2+-binding RTX toxin-like protein